MPMDAVLGVHHGQLSAHPVKHRAVQVDLEHGRGPETLDQRDGSARAFAGLQPSAGLAHWVANSSL